MKFFGWMQNKLHGKQGSSKPNTVSASDHMKQDPRDEFGDWPCGLLAIGTFGNDQSQTIVHRDPVDDRDELSSTEDGLEEFTVEEVAKLQKELTKLLTRKPASGAGKEAVELPLDRFLNCPSSLEVDRRISNEFCSDSGESEEEIDRTISAIIGKCKHICAENKKKSISFLLKKMFACGSGFSPTPSLRDTLQESTMEKVLRVMLRKKIQGRNPCRASSTKKYLANQQTPGGQNNQRDETQERNNRWVKSDPEYIVLEI
ncbi:hypothetical protein V6N13_093905 [Hibiscus sabdariffa]|uniref:Uncharacterized protein n=1 Tax=Hibiscus sabdariffa TaxID=183260 RepID=A0ABR2NL55_9ROSI